MITLICVCIAFVSFISGMFWNEAGHELKKEAEENERRQRVLQRNR